MQTMIAWWVSMRGREGGRWRAGGGEGREEKCEEK